MRDDDGAARLNTFRVAHRTLNGIRTGTSLERFDAHYRPIREVAVSKGEVHRWSYTPDGWLLWDQLGSESGVSSLGTRRERDAAGRVTRSFEYRPPTFDPTGAETTFTYRGDGQPATVTEHGVTRTYRYDDAGGTLNQLGWTDTIGRAVSHALDARGNVIETSDGTASSSAVFDVHNRVTETRDALGNATLYGYAHAGCGCSQAELVTSIHTPDLPAGVEWRMTYDGQSRLSTVTDPHGFTEAYEYEPTGELRKTTDKLSRANVWSHDGLGRVTSMIDALGRVHGHTYASPLSGAWVGPTLMAGSADATAASPSLAGALRAGDYQIGQNGYPTEGYPATVSLYRDATFELGLSRTFDVHRRLLSRFDRVGLPMPGTTPSSTGAYWSEQHVWNGLTAAPVPLRVSSAKESGGAEQSSYVHDAYFDRTRDDGFSDNFVLSTDTRVIQTHTRDVAGRLTTLERDFIGGGGTSAPLALNVLSTYTYRPDGRISRLVNPDGQHDFTYDSRGLMQTQTILGEGTYSYGYDEMGRNASLEYPDMHVRRQVYDDLGRITSRCYEYAAEAPRCYTAQYDAVGNPVRMSDPEGVDVLTYDALDRLTSVTREVGGVPVAVENYAYNALGALKVNAGITLDDQRPRLVGGGTADAAVPASLGGQPVTLSSGGFVTTLRGTTFSWSPRGMLRQLQEPIPAAPEHVGYDSDLRRVSRQRGGVVEFYVYEGLDRVATIAPGGALIEGFLFDGIDHPLRIKQTTTGTTAYYELDLAGNVRALRASGAGNLGGYRYSAFGQTLEDTSTLTQSLRWKGRWFSPAAGGIYDVRARQWNPELGAFLSVDEYKYHDARSTLWGWPRQNPLRWRDPSGRIGLGDTDSSDRAIRGWRGPDWHRCRNRKNICPTRPPNTCSGEKDNRWVFGAGGHAKWRSSLGYECAYDEKGDLLPDEYGHYTYNYEPDPSTFRHILFDVIPHFLFGGEAGYERDLTNVEVCE